MPNAETVRTLLEARFPRSMDAWRERLERALYDGAHKQPILVRIIPSDASKSRLIGVRWIARPDVQEQAAAALDVQILRYLGCDEFIIALRADGQENQLSLYGHLDVACGEFRMIAI